MCAFSPTPLFSFFGWPLEDTISHEQQHCMIRETENPGSFPQFLPSQQEIEPEIKLDPSTSATAISGDPNMVKKLNHNASERDRRKKINTLYSSLRSLLPEADQMKKLSIPATVSKVLKYIPDLQHQVERLFQKKEELLSKISKQEAVINQENQGKRTLHSSLSSVSASQLSDRDVVVQICSYKLHRSPLSEILISLEKEGLVLINCSSFESFGGGMFHNLHLQMDGTYKLECEALSEKLMSFCERRESLFP